MTGPAPPSPFILEQIEIWLANRAENVVKQPVQLVDLACGSGRHITALLGRENKEALEITAVDVNLQSLETLTSSTGNIAKVTAVCLDLEGEGLNLVEALRGKLFDLVLITNYLHRPLLGQIFGLARPGGLLLYETFGQGNADFGRPSNPDFLLREGELSSALPKEFELRHQFFGQRQDIYPDRPPAIIYQFAAQRQVNPSTSP